MTGCRCGKSSFANKRRAESALETIRRKQQPGADGEIPRRSYPCPRGNGWHLTHIDGDTDMQGVRLKKQRRNRNQRLNWNGDTE